MSLGPVKKKNCGHFTNEDICFVNDLEGVDLGDVHGQLVQISMVFELNIKKREVCNVYLSNFEKTTQNDIFVFDLKVALIPFS
jgi:hypothetical protein